MVTIKSLFGFCRLGVVLVGLLGLFVVVGSAQAVLVQQGTITQTGGEASDFFGRSVALSSDGNTAIVGAYGDDVSGAADQGSATIYTRSGTSWTQQQTITQSDGAATDSFGWSVALSSDGNTAIVGAYRDNSYQGSASIFTRSGTTWTQQQIITQTGVAVYDYFGYSVALSSDGNTAIVGAYGDDVSGAADQGSASVFTRTSGTWTQQQTITQSDGVGIDAFGYSVALSSDGNTAIVGAYKDNSNQGSASIFTRSGTTWTQQQTITQTSGAANDFFGVSVALSSDGNTAIVGAYGDDGSFVDQGTATVFTRSGTTWTQQQTITQPGGAGSDLFGISVALSSDGNTAIVGAYWDNVGSIVDQGSATVFTRSGTTWTQQQTITQTGGAANDYFGISVALSSDGNTAIVGAYGDDSFRGSATIFGLGVVPGVPTSVSGTSGANGQSVVSWSAPVSDGGLTITGYTVTASSGGASCSWTTGALSCTVTGLMNGTSYTFTVTATNAAGTSSASSASSAATPYTVAGVPTSVSASSGANAQSVVSWTAPVSDGGSTITGYTVTASSGGASCSWTTGALSCTVTGLTNGTSYTFTVTATNAAGTSSASSASSAATPSAVPPGVPTSVSGTSGANGQSVVSWTAPVSDGGSTITGYTVTASPGGRSCSWTTGLLSCTVTGLTNATSYTFTVTATNAAGTSSASSASSAATPYTVAGVPTSVSASSGANAQSVVSWTAPTSDGGSTITGYTVTASPGGRSCSWTTGLLSCTVTGLMNGTSYTFTVTATNAAGTSSASSASSAATPYTLSGVPTSVSGTSGANGQSVVSWSAPVSDGGLTITGYTVTASSGGASCLWTTGALSCTVTGLMNATSYTFTVTATNAAGTSTASAPSSTITPTAPTPTAAPATAAPATNAPTTAAPATPVNVKWTKRRITTLVATFSATTGTNYLITATFTKAARTLRIATTKGSCKIKSGKTTCSIKLKTRGTWSVTITPMKNGSLGMPVKKIFKIKAWRFDPPLAIPVAEAVLRLFCVTSI